MEPEDWQGLEAAPIDGLGPEVFRDAAERLRSSPDTFIARVTRESELDAMWTLVDLAVNAAARTSPDSSGRPWLPGATTDQLLALGRIIFEAHDLSAEGHFVAAAELMDDAAERARGYVA